MDNEKTLLITAIMRPVSQSIIFELTEDHFNDFKNKIIFKALKELFHQNITLDTSSIRMYLQSNGLAEKAGGDSYLSELYKHESTMSERYIVNKLKERDNKNFIKNITTDLLQGKITREEWTTKIDQLQFIDNNESISVGAMSDLDLDDVFRSNNFLPTGFKKFDQSNGGFWRGELEIIGARPGVGKSALALNLVKNINNSMFFSLEMSRAEIYGRLLALETGINSRKIKLKSLDGDESKIVLSVHKKMKDKYSLIFVDKLFNIYEIINFIKKTCREQLVSSVVIDYLQLIHIDGSVNRNEKIGEITRLLKQTAANIGIPIIALSQLSRATETQKRPTMANLRESGNIEQDANIIWLMHYNEESGNTELIIEKNRDGEANYTISTKFQKEISTFKEIYYGNGF